ncbi:four-carbon acid sugar kinase family protein [Microvirga terrae]|uniref:3-oxo-tetronate kinase n=1 Tax=Microvirga terrae TaxID=2740529 RepID=A0ABY5RMG1_9HYPH|nr:MULTISPECIES: 3-oxo-tetronate kinase [Microvirga]MBQ0822002.1 four-carbon acid sugar kinase family protein [Microvirga sp. HBU67558]UVF17571.1 four-carbon acid sugar kinase family protein [Microvirga terrae]
MKLGCIADDLTGATDLALMLAREGLRTIQTIGAPRPELDLSGADAVVAALKSRTIPAMEAIDQSLAAAQILRTAGAEHLFFKYCSTFDSTDEGNIGPVTDALLTFTGSDFTLACPAFPANGRTVYKGHLFVNGVPLHESSMKDHPLTPMRDSNLVRVLQRQTKRPVGLVAYEDVEAGPDAIRAAFAREKAAGHQIVIVDALSDDHLRAIGLAAADLPLMTGGSGVAMGLPAAYRRGERNASPASTGFDAPAGRSIILAGSCSSATRAQVKAAIEAGIPTLRLDALDLASGAMTAGTALDWLNAQATTGPALIYSTATPEEVQAVQNRLGRMNAGEIVERTLAEIAKALPGLGFTRLIVAGGETSGAVVNALDVDALAIGPEIDPGVPWTRSLAGIDLALALKSGNFGTPDFFLKAWTMLR